MDSEGGEKFSRISEKIFVSRHLTNKWLKNQILKASVKTFFSILNWTFTPLMSISQMRCNYQNGSKISELEKIDQLDENGSVDQKPDYQNLDEPIK